jgi:hypothetical protein
MSDFPSATIGSCSDFKDTNMSDGEIATRTIIITPLRMIKYPESVKISFGCNLYKSCHNLQCSYCQEGMPEHDFHTPAA